MKLTESKSALESSLWLYNKRKIKYKFINLSATNGVLTGTMVNGDSTISSNNTQYEFELEGKNNFKFNGANPFAGVGRTFKIQFEPEAIHFMLQAIGTAELDPDPIILEKID